MLYEVITGEAVKARHLNVEKHQVRLPGLDLADRFAPVRAGVDDFDRNNFV